MSNVKDIVSNTFLCLSSSYKSFIEYITTKIIPENYRGLPIEKAFIYLLVITFAILLLSHIIKNRNKRYYASVFTLSMLIEIISITMLGITKGSNNSKMLLDTTQGFFICLIGLSYYSIAISLYKMCKHKRKCILPIMFLTFVESYLYMMLRNEFTTAKINMLSSLGIILVSPLWLVYVPYAAIGLAYIYGISSLTLVGANTKNDVK